MKQTLLEKVQSPADIKKMDYRELEELCSEIREFLIDKVSKTGGHLSSNLGVIELTVAIHRVFNSPKDVIVFDVGHQCYTHKLLTGRREGFDNLRKANGASGFPTPVESKHDIVRAGHASAALSTAIGIARAKKINNEPGMVIAIVGDGAFTGGMTYEGINNINGLDNIVIVLNDNNMSISKNVGALAHYLTTLRTSPQYYKAKNDVKIVLDNTPVIGGGIKNGIQSFKTSLRKSIYHTTFFEEMGLRYLGPVDGHDLPALCNVFGAIRQLKKPALLHVETVKGKGFVPAEKNPGAFHGVPAFNIEKITDPDVSPRDSFSTTFGRELASLAAENKKICAITAAMKYGTGLQFFKKAHIDRFYDVGMAEEHAVTFAGGLAAGGMLPVVAIYSTFLQRAYDQIIHDVMLGGQNVLFAIDRAGLVPDDGETHQGIYDAAFLSQQADMPIVSPSNYAELQFWLKKLINDYTCPRAIRYPRGTEPASLAEKPCSGNSYDHLVASKKPKAAIVTYGAETAEALEAAEHLEKSDISVDVFQMVMINPLPEGLVQKLLKYPVIVFPEEGIARGGIGEHLTVELYKEGYSGQFIHKAVTDIHLNHAPLAQLKKDIEISAGDITNILTMALAPAPAKITQRTRKKSHEA